MCGARKFSLDYLEREDIAALTRQAAEVSGISYVMDLDREEVDEILGQQQKARAQARNGLRPDKNKRVARISRHPLLV